MGQSTNTHGTLLYTGHDMGQNTNTWDTIWDRVLLHTGHDMGQNTNTHMGQNTNTHGTRHGTELIHGTRYGTEFYYTRDTTWDRVLIHTGHDMG